MFRKANALVSSKAFAATLLAMILSASAYAYQPPSTGLGQAWPNAADVSASPHYHVYVFARDGIRYIQINDLGGTVLAAVAVANNEALVLPVGVDSQYVTTSQVNDESAKASDDAQSVYSDGVTQITATPASNGVVRINVGMTDGCPDPSDCTAQVISRIAQ
jgi:hypothetical protein